MLHLFQKMILLIWLRKLASGEIILSKNEKVVGIAIHPETGLMLQFE